MCSHLFQWLYFMVVDSLPKAIAEIKVIWFVSMGEKKENIMMKIGLLFTTKDQSRAKHELQLILKNQWFFDATKKNTNFKYNKLSCVFFSLSLFFHDFRLHIRRKKNICQLHLRWRKIDFRFWRKMKVKCVILFIKFDVKTNYSVCFT